MSDILSSLTWGSGSITFPYGCFVTVQKEYERNGPGIAMTEKQTITVKGSIAGSSLSDLITAGGSVADVSSGNSRQIASLVIEVNGATVVDVSNARLSNAGSSEPPDDTAGVQYIDVSLTFEAYNSAGGDYVLSSSSESLEVKKEEDRLFPVNNDITSDEQSFGYTITHTISAQGIDAGADGYSQAQSWVNSRKQDSSKNLTLTKDGNSSFLQSSLSIDSLMGSLPEYECNAARSVTADPASGSFSMTSTFFRTGSKATFDITVNVERSEDGGVTGTSSGTVQGMSTAGISATTTTKFGNAKEAFDAICGNFGSGSQIYSVISALFNKLSPEGVILDDYAIGLSVGENKTNGSMNFNVTYRAYPAAVKALMEALGDALSASITISHDNESGVSLDNQVFASIPIIGRLDGPVLQDMGTTRERKKSVQVECLMKPAARSPGNEAPRKACLNEAKTYAPAGTVFRSNVSSTWDFAAGRASANIEWTYQ
jgi:hypothetical protein